MLLRNSDPNDASLPDKLARQGKRVREVADTMKEEDMCDLNREFKVLINNQLARPVYFKVEQGQGGGYSIAQIQFLRTDDLAALTNLEPRTIRSWVAKGMVPYYKAPGSSIVLFDAGEVIAVIKQSGLTNGGVES